MVVVSPMLALAPVCTTSCTVVVVVVVVVDNFITPNEKLVEFAPLQTEKLAARLLLLLLRRATVALEHIAA